MRRRALRTSCLAALALILIVSPARAQDASDPADVHAGSVFSTGQWMTNFAPEFWWRGQNGSWVAGIDSSAPVPGRDFVIGFRPDPGDSWCCVADFMYFHREGPGHPEPVLGIGYTIPPTNARVTVGATGPVGGVQVVQPHTDLEGYPFAVTGGNGQDRWHMDANLWMSPTSIQEVTLGSPEHSYRLGLEWGDALVLRQRGAPILRIHEGGNVLVWRNGSWQRVLTQSDYLALEKRIAELERKLGR